jgi:hypothetical protein
MHSRGSGQHVAAEVLVNQMLESVAIWMMAPAIAALTVGGSTVPERVAAVEPVSVVIHVAQNKTSNTSG